MDPELTSDLVDAVAGYLDALEAAVVAVTSEAPPEPGSAAPARPSAASVRMLERTSGGGPLKAVTEMVLVAVGCPALG